MLARVVKVSLNFPGYLISQIAHNHKTFCPIHVPFFDHNLHVLCEKPLTTSIEDARAMNAYGLFSFRNHVRPGQPAQRLGLSLTK